MFNYIGFFVPDTLCKLFTVVKYSSKGTSCRIKEETAYSYFIDYLDACEKGSALLTVHDHLCS